MLWVSWLYTLDVTCYAVTCSSVVCVVCIHIVHGHCQVLYNLYMYMHAILCIHFMWQLLLSLWDIHMCVDCSWTCGLCTVLYCSHHFNRCTIHALVIAFLRTSRLNPFIHVVYMASNYSCLHTTISLPLAVKGSPLDPAIHYCEESQWIQLGPKAL